MSLPPNIPVRVISMTWPKVRALTQDTVTWEQVNSLGDEREEWGDEARKIKGWPLSLLLRTACAQSQEIPLS